MPYGSEYSPTETSLRAPIPMISEKRRFAYRNSPPGARATQMPNGKSSATAAINPSGRSGFSPPKPRKDRPTHSFGASDRGPDVAPARKPTAPTCADHERRRHGRADGQD